MSFAITGDEKVTLAMALPPFDVGAFLSEAARASSGPARN
jgi:hypothetical protein